ncbi:Exocyst complex component EXO70B1 like [Actinidia chinensis var. chinensis]|uniref:Exocyst subunit Exo70 family protein n=1 Tax=Actinidia chinensis var. chinensis TaxID=1590841 RepID=A0A2R6QJE4_ACTCC|nr:Exocyst complex component EXO70B1 like [Actinidia chinensis var. chinensis]
MEASMAENGEEKLIAMARHIAKTLGHNENMADDILKIFSNFDGRFREKLSEKLSDEGPRAPEQILKSLDCKISQYVSADHPIWSDSADADAFLDAVDELVAAVRDWTPMASEKSVAACLDRADNLLQKSMFRLETEFRTLIERGGESFDLTHFQNGESSANYSFGSEADNEDDDGGELIGEEQQIPVAHPVTDYVYVIDALPSGTINDLQEIAKRMVVAGYGKECSHVYSSCRREFLEESLSRLGLQKLSIEEVQKMPWTDLEDEIDRWNKAANVALRTLFPSERRLCDRVFLGFSSSDLSFMEVCRGSTTQLLNFADAVAIGSRAPERLFKVLDMFETLHDLMPEFEAVFSDPYCLFLRNEATTICKHLGETIKGIFTELENLIRRDPAKVPVPGGGLHPITRYVMNYLRAACRSRQSLEQVFEESMAPPSGGDYTSLDDRSMNSSSLSVQMAWIMELLESNLESKAKIYRDPALCSVFMMNSGRYIVQKVQDSELGSLLGDDWIRKHKAKVRRFHMNYQRSSWNKVLGTLKQDHSAIGSNGASRAMKEKLKLFNMYFDEIWKAQSTWVICDEQLKEEMKISLVKILSMPYRSFLGWFQNLPDIARHEKHIKYSVEDIEARISELFQGRVGSAGGRK